MWITQWMPSKSGSCRFKWTKKKPRWWSTIDAIETMFFPGVALSVNKKSTDWKIDSPLVSISKYVAKSSSCHIFLSLINRTYPNNRASLSSNVDSSNWRENLLVSKNLHKMFYTSRPVSCGFVQYIVKNPRNVW